VCEDQSHRKPFTAPVAVLLILCLFSSSLPFGIHSGTASAADSVFYDFIAQAPSASWSSGAGNLPFPGSDSDSRGFALYRDNWQLEDNTIRSRVLETHPQWVSNGWIMGRYPELTVPSNAELKVTVGFLKGATASDGVTFEVRFEEFLGLQVAPKVHSILSRKATYDGTLDSITADLGSVQGKTGNFVLYVSAGQSSGQDWAAWAEAKIEAEPDTTRPIVTISPSPAEVTTADTVTFTAQATDANSVAKITIFVNDQQVKECAPPSQKADGQGGKYWECTYTGGPYDEGTLTYQAKAIDSFQNEGISNEESVEVTVSITPVEPPVTACLFSISGKILDFPYPPEMLKIVLCEAQLMPLPPEMGGPRWVCKSGGHTMECPLMSHDTYEFNRLCPGTYLITPVIQPYDDLCQPQGIFWNPEHSHGGARVVTVPDEYRADFVFVPRENDLPEINISISPEDATTEDDVQLIVSASGANGIGGIRIEGQIEKVWELREHCRTETYEGHEIEVCDEDEYGTTEDILQECSSSSCTYAIPTSDYDRYELSLTITAWDTLCNTAVLEEYLVIDKYRTPPPAYPTGNERNIGAYREREVFMVSDRDWRTALSLIPVAYGTYYAGEGEFTGRPYIPTGASIDESAYLPSGIKFPLLIFHQEPEGLPYDGSFDIDSAVTFVRQYRPDYLTVFIGNEVVNDRLDDHLYYWFMVDGNIIPSEPRMGDNINWYDANPSARIRFFDAANISEVYGHYFSDIHSVIVCQDDYEAGLSTCWFAAHSDLPLYFDGHFSPEDIQDKVVHIVGDIRPETRGLIDATARAIGSLLRGTTVVESPYSLGIMQPGLRSILVNPHDLDTPLSQTIHPATERSFEVRAFGANSLAAAVLAAATGRSIRFSNYEGVFTDDSACGSSPTHDQLRAIIEDIKGDPPPRYPDRNLVIVASPAHIPDSYYTGCADDWAQRRHQVDREYGASGRIYGLTVTDTSAYIARVIFYNDIVGTRDVISALLISHTISAEENKAYNLFRDLTDSPDYEVTGYFGSRRDGCIQSTSPPLTEYPDKDLIIFADHGSYDGWSDTLASWDIPELDGMPVVFGEACLTGNFWQGGVDTMGPNWIRHGAIAYFGAVGVSQYPDCYDGYSYTCNPNRFMSSMAAGRSLGETSNMIAYCVGTCCGGLGYCWLDDCSYRDHYILLGDPCLVVGYPAP